MLWESRDPLRTPEAIVGVTPRGATLFLDVRGPWAGRLFGTTIRASSKTFAARSAIGNVPVDRLRSANLFELHAYFLGTGRWAGMSASKDSWNPDKGKLREWTVTLTEGETLRSRINGGREIMISTKWRVEGPEDQRTLSAPVTIGCVARRPVELRDLLQPVLAAQDLLSFVFNGFVAATDGAVRLDSKPGDGGFELTPSFWSGALMVRSPAAQALGRSIDFPLVDLQTLGGIDGLGRWIRLALSHPRAVRALWSPYREGRGSAAMSMMDVATSIEYWVNANRHRAAWANVPGKNRARPLVNHCGRAFSNWVGDTDIWADTFWDAYNSLKHDPSFDPAPSELIDLAESARHMLGAALLNRAAGSMAPSREVFDHPRLSFLGSRLRERFA